MTSVPARPSWSVLAAVALGGALGSLARWGVGCVFWGYAGWPWGTFLVNVTGSFALGVVMVLVLEVRPLSRFARPFWGVGVCGGYTTFSAYALEVHHLLVAGRAGLAVAYAVGSVLAGVLAVALGMIAARRILCERGA
ncbi:fluoride efflux transporter CrcB [Granulicoccus sp. GXG6511]|uniref:fluoride efflux transporter CrcB n=1 Tax=Granulicoccus sp. GXG6511 TaxID=3381351 RepID=UPI003D7F0C8A